MYYIKISNIVFAIDTVGFSINPDDVANAFYQNNVKISECINIQIQPLPYLPMVGGKAFWQNEICEVRQSGNYEIRIYKDAVTQIPFAVYSDQNGENPRVLVREDWLLKNKDSIFLFNIFAVEKHLAKYERIVFHTCFTAYRGGAILFSGQSGAGKSTQGDLWHKYRNAMVVNGDRCVLGIDKEKYLMAYGFPFSGTSGICMNRCFPVKAIVFIIQSSVNSIQKIPKEEAVQKIWQQVTANQWNIEFVDCVFRIIEQIPDMVPVYELSCTPDEDAVLCLEQELKCFK